MWRGLMHKAMEQAARAAREGDAPFGCVVVDGSGKIVWEDRDRVGSTCDPTAHAEINAIRGLCKRIGQTKLDGLTFVTTSEPCVTCLSALIRVRAKRCVFGATIERDASLPLSSLELSAKASRHKIELVGGILAVLCDKQRTELSESLLLASARF